MRSGALRMACDDTEVSHAVIATTTDDAVPAWAPLVATAAAVAPILVAAPRALGRGWLPIGDDAYFSVRAWDVFSRDIPLLGTASSGSGRVTDQGINHPGPLQFDLLAVPTRALGHTVGTTLGQALINAVAVALAAWLVHRMLGRVAATVAMAGFALLVWSMGSEVLYRPWGPYAVVLPFALFLVAVWGSVAGDRVALVVAVVAGSYCVQTNLAYALLVPGLAALAAGATVLRLVRAGTPAARRAAARGGALALAVGALVWAQPLLEQLIGPQHNLTALARSPGGGGATPGVGPALGRLAQTVALPRAWLPPSFRSPPYPLAHPPPLTRAVPALVLLAAVTALLAWRAWRRGSHAIAAAGITSLAALALGAITMVRVPLYFGIPFHEILWLWPLGLFTWLVIAVGLVDEWRATTWSRASQPRLIAGAACALALVAGLAALPTRAGIHSPYAWAWPGVRAVDDDVVAAVRDKGPILVDIPVSDQAALIGPALFPVLQREGIPFVVSDDAIARTLGERRRYEPGEAHWRLTILGPADSPPPAGHDLVAEWSDADDATLSELARLTDDLRSALADQGLPLAPGGADRVVAAGEADLLPIIEHARTDPDAVLEGDTLARLWQSIPTYVGGPVLDADRLPTDSLPRWIELHSLASTSSVYIYLGPIDAPVDGTAAE